MPAVDYDYDYYRNSRKVNKTANEKRATNRVDPYLSSSSRSARPRTSQSTKNQVRMAMYAEPKKVVARKTKNSALEIPTMQSSRNHVASKNHTVSKSSNNKSSLKTQTNKNSKPAEMKLKKPEISAAQKKKEKQKVMARVKNVFYIGCAFAIAFLICYRYSLINEKFNQLEKTKRELATAKTVNEQIQADIDSQTDLAYIENYAKYQLGMQKPSNSQIVYVNVEKEDRILTPVTIEEDTNKTWFEQLYEEIVKLFE